MKAIIYSHKQKHKNFFKFGLDARKKSLPFKFSSQDVHMKLLFIMNTTNNKRKKNTSNMAPWSSQLLSTGGSWVRLPLYPSHRDLGQVLCLQLPVRFGVKLRYSIRAVVGSASEW